MAENIVVNNADVFSLTCINNVLFLYYIMVNAFWLEAIVIILE